MTADEGVVEPLAENAPVTSALDPDGSLRDLAGDCVHCGFCLPSCPTYQLWGEEMDSPRGRIHLITQVLQTGEGSAAVAEHLDRCLGCMACMTACPSGVQYDQLIEAARTWGEGASAGPGSAASPKSAASPSAASPPAAASPSAEPASAAPPGARSGSTVPGSGPGSTPPGSGPGSTPPGSGPGSTPPGSGPGSTVPGSAGAGRASGRGRRPDAPVAPLPPRSRRDRAVRAAIFATFPYPARLRAALGPLRLAQLTGLDKVAARSSLLARVAPEAVAALAVAPPRPTGAGYRDGRRPRFLSSSRRAVNPSRIPARGERRAVVGMLTGCVQQVLFPHVNSATANVLAAEGCDVIIPAGQGCCGALSLHGGRRAEAAAFARSLIATFEAAGVDAIIVNAAGCGSAMKEYARLLGGDLAWAGRAAAVSAKVRDFSEFLAELGPVAPRSELPLSVAYHDACHLGHAQRITAQPRALLSGIPGLTVTEIADAGTCCGSAGIYNLVQPEAAAELGARKARTVAATGADLLVSANPGCSLQIAQALAATGQPMPVAHIAEVLDTAISGRPLRQLLGS